MRTITVREAYDWLQLGKDIDSVDWDELISFLHDKYMNMVEMKYRRIRFINLVGVIQLTNIRIEILPKLAIDSESLEKNRMALLNMLVVTRTFPVDIDKSTYSQMASADLLQIVAEYYTVLLAKEVRNGIHKEYQFVQQNSSTLKGKLVVSQHIRKNAFVPIHAFCEFDSFQEDHTLNRILKKALILIFPHIKRSTVRSHARLVMDTFQHVFERNVQKSDINKVTFHRQNKRFETVFELAKMILQEEMVTSKYNNRSSFSFLFEMNSLFESYIEKCLQRIAWQQQFNLFSQHDEKHLLINVKTERENIKLKPDFYLVDRHHETIIDTKWKNIAYEGRILYQQADLYQMYAYVNTYKQVNKCVLLYPRTEEEDFPIWKVPDKEKFIEIHTVRLTTLSDTLTDLKEVLSS